MPNLNINGTDIFYRDEGQGAETLIFAHGLLFSSEMYRNQIEVLKAKYRCISLDFKGQGKSGIGKGGYDMDTLTDEVLELIEKLHIRNFHFIGLSMGGFVGMRLALRNPVGLISLILLNTTAEKEPIINIPKYTMLNFIARWFGLKKVIDKVLPTVFSQDFLSNPNRADEKKFWKNQLISNDRIGITRAVKGVIYRKGVDHEIAKINIPTLIVSGEYDVATVPKYSKKINQAIKGSKWVSISDAAHTSTIENPEMVNKSIIEFLSSIRSTVN